jgi:NADH:ubiquinone oxidoreductase subunit K/Sec-independent protein translocase protein TatA
LFSFLSLRLAITTGSSSEQTVQKSDSILITGLNSKGFQISDYSGENLDCAKKFAHDMNLYGYKRLPESGDSLRKIVKKVKKSSTDDTVNQSLNPSSSHVTEKTHNIFDFNNPTAKDVSVLTDLSKTYYNPQFRTLRVPYPSSAPAQPFDIHPDYLFIQKMFSFICDKAIIRADAEIRLRIFQRTLKKKWPTNSFYYFFEQINDTFFIFLIFAIFIFFCINAIHFFFGTNNLLQLVISLEFFLFLTAYIFTYIEILNFKNMSFFVIPFVILAVAAAEAAIALSATVSRYTQVKNIELSAMNTLYN